jgi:hypothetical protein
MMNSQQDAQQRDDQSAAGLAGKPGTRKKMRPTYSCLSCHKRKVKVYLPTQCYLVLDCRSLSFHFGVT